MKELCLISPKFCNYIGGMETHSYEFAKHFSNNTLHKLCAIYTRDHVNDGVTAPIGEQDEIRFLQKSLPHQSTQYIKEALEKLHEQWNGLIKPHLTGDFESDAIEILNNTDPQNTIYFLNSPTWAPISKSIKQRCPDAKVIIRSGGNDIVAGWIGDETDKTHQLEESRSNLTSIINQYVDYFIVNSNYSYQRTIEVGVNPSIIVKTIGGVDCSEFTPAINYEKDRIVILTTGRLVHFKGIEHSIEAFRQVTKRTDVPLQYVIVGDGPERERLESLAKDLNGQVIFTGAKNIIDMPEQYRSADIFLHLPIQETRCERGSSYTHTETMGRSLCEAAATGLPIIGSAVGGVPEIVSDGEMGFIVTERDSMAAADRLFELISSSNLRDRLSANARTRAVNEFDWKRIFECYYELFK